MACCASIWTVFDFEKGASPVAGGSPKLQGGLLRGTSLSSIINEPLVLFLLPLLSREFETPPT